MLFSKAFAVKYAEEGGEKKRDAFNGGQWLQVSDVTDSWPIIVRRFGVFDPLKHSAAKGI